MRLRVLERWTLRYSLAVLAMTLLLTACPGGGGGGY
jgi:hypothetical protein